MEKIIESINNGQRVQALTQLSKSEFTFEDLAEELLETPKNRELLTILKVALHEGYLKEVGLDDSSLDI